MVILAVSVWELYLIRKGEPQYKRIMKYTYTFIGIKALLQVIVVIELFLGIFLSSIFEVPTLGNDHVISHTITLEIRIFLMTLTMAFIIGFPCLFLGYFIPKHIRTNPSPKKNKSENTNNQ
jgi:ABC-type Fe3+ transport system permease subunit